MSKEIFLDHKPIFIVGCPRSGTTILASLLNAHSEIASATETHFFNYIASEKKYDWQNFDENQMRLIIEEARIQDFCKHLNIDSSLLMKFFVEDFDSAELMEESLAKEKFYKKKFFNTLIKVLLYSKSKLRFCEKTPQHLMNTEEILELYPNAKFINIVRDGRDVVNSLIKMPWRPSGLINNSRFWKQYINKGLSLDKLLNSNLDKDTIPDNLMTVKFEDLIRNPESVLKRICLFVGSEFQSQMLRQGFDDSESVFTEWETNWKHKSREDLDQSRISAWKKELSDQDQIIINWHQESLLSKLGYKIDKPKIGAFEFIRIIQEYVFLFARKIFRVFSHFVN